MNDKASFRPLEGSDLPRLSGLIDDVGLFPSHMLAEMTASYLSGNPSGEIWIVGEQDGQLVSVAYCVPEKLTEGTWNLLLIAVDPAMQGRGTGGSLLAWLEHHLESRKERLLIVETSGLPDFAKTRTFYERNGFRQEARIRDFYRQGDDKIVYAKPLKASW